MPSEGYRIWLKERKGVSMAKQEPTMGLGMAIEVNHRDVAIRMAMDCLRRAADQPDYNSEYVFRQLQSADGYLHDAMDAAIADAVTHRKGRKEADE